MWCSFTRFAFPEARLQEMPSLCPVWSVDSLAKVQSSKPADSVLPAAPSRVKPSSAAVLYWASVIAAR